MTWLTDKIESGRLFISDNKGDFYQMKKRAILTMEEIKLFQQNGKMKQQS